MIPTRRSGPVLMAFLLLAGGALACVTYMPPAPPAAPHAPVSVGASSAMSEEIVVRTNAERKALGLPAFARSSQLMQAAQLQAEQMAQYGRMSHDLKEAHYPYLADRLAVVDYAWRATAENVGEGYTDAAAVVTGWMNSKGHRANIVSDLFNEMGAGEAADAKGRRYFAQVFGAQR